MGLQSRIVTHIQHTQTILASMEWHLGLVTILVTDQRVVRMNPHRLWRLQRHLPFVDRVLLNSHCEKDFRKRMRVGPATFFYLCSLLAPIMQRSKKGGGIPLAHRVAVSLNRLGTGNYLMSCADLFGMSEATACIVVREFCAAILKVLRPLVVPQFNAQALPKLAKAFEAKHGIPYIIGAIDGSHIPIIAPGGDPVPFYNRKGFYSCLLQGIVDTNTTFWDWDFGWAGSLHDYTLFVNSAIGRELLRGDYHPYKFIGDAAYPYRTSMYIPFKGSKENLPAYMAHWNFIQSSTRMCVERAFGILKGRWRILLRRIEMRLDHVYPVVGACICLHNLCIMHGDFGDDTLVEESKKWLQVEKIQNFGDLREQGTLKILEYAQEEMHRNEVPIEEVLEGIWHEDAEKESDEVLLTDDDSVQALRAGVSMHKTLAKALFRRHLRENVSLPEGLPDSSDEASSDFDE